ncbi:hypothetical protein WJX84_004892 [Apatococcus fuscideae]|uniref:Phosphatidate cytidylyltransferase, mitochondrial n=1 Tax=Apatococcus fuscideae TaxID=2026836 RepID=A0AAW1ST04_9CHLO
MSSRAGTLAPQQLSNLLKLLPDVQYAFGYGSGVFRQPNLYEAGQQPLLDFVVAVEDPAAWHAQNIQQNRQHYSFLRWLGGGAIDLVTEHLAAGVFFNANVVLGDQRVKYGVVSLKRLHRDLQHWDDLFVAGRLHKPVIHIIRGNLEVSQSIAANLDAALRLALLLLPQRFSERDLYRTICRISYLGDIRMGIAEDADKVDRIVAGSFSSFEALYGRRMIQGRVAESAQLARSYTGSWRQTPSRAAHLQMTSELPMGLLTRACKVARVTMEDEAVGLARVRLMAGSNLLEKGNLQHSLTSAASSLVRRSSRRQALAGPLMAGPWASLTYLSQKVMKAWRRRPLPI